MSSSIQKRFNLYRGSHCLLDNWPSIIKYGLHLNFLPNNETYYSKNQKKIANRSKLDYLLEKDQDRLVKNLPKNSNIQRFKLNFKRNPSHDHDFYKSLPAIDSQGTVNSEDEDTDNSENELDIALKGSNIIHKNSQNLKKILFSRLLKRVTDLFLNFEKIDPPHNKAFQWLPLLTMLENCFLKVKIRSHRDLLGLKDLLKIAKQRNHWPNMKLMMINLRHSYNKGNCNLKFLRFCEIFQEITKIAQDLPYIKVKLKVKYMWRLDEVTIQALQKAFEEAENQFVKLSLVTFQPKRLQPLFKTIEEMNSLQKFSLRYKALKDLNDIESLEGFLESLKKIKT